jgi:uncharacterized protein (TIGR03437 family)
VDVHLADACPALFLLDPEFVVATHADWKPITRQDPARGGEVIVLYATGLGQTSPRTYPNELVEYPAPIDRLWDFRVQLGDRELPHTAVEYAGTVAGFAGLYQINLKLPDVLEHNPEIRIGFADVMSPPGVRLLTQ